MKKKTFLIIAGVIICIIIILFACEILFFNSNINKKQTTELIIK